MADILLKQLNPNVYTYHIKNREQFTVRLTTPVVAVENPEASYTTNSLTKVMGNTARITIVWRLVQPDSSVTTLVDQLTGGNAILTPQSQLDFLINTFESKGYNYSFAITDDGTVTPPFTFNGLVEELNIEQVEGDAATYKATLTFIVGTVVAVN